MVAAIILPCVLSSPLPSRTQTIYRAQVAPTTTYALCACFSLVAPRLIVRRFRCLAFTFSAGSPLRRHVSLRCTCRRHWLRQMVFILLLFTCPASGRFSRRLWRLFTHGPRRAYGSSTTLRLWQKLHSLSSLLHTSATFRTVSLATIPTSPTSSLAASPAFPLIYAASQAAVSVSST